MYVYYSTLSRQAKTAYLGVNSNAVIIISPFIRCKLDNKFNKHSWYKLFLQKKGIYIKVKNNMHILHNIKIYEQIVITARVCHAKVSAGKGEAVIGVEDMYAENWPV